MQLDTLVKQLGDKAITQTGQLVTNVRDRATDGFVSRVTGQWFGRGQTQRVGLAKKHGYLQRYGKGVGAFPDDFIMPIGGSSPGTKMRVGTFTWKIIDPCELLFDSIHGFGLDLNSNAPYGKVTQQQFGCTGSGRWYQILALATVNAAILGLPTPTDAIFVQTFGAEAEATYQNNGQTWDDWWWFATTDQKRYLEMELTGPLDYNASYWFDSGPACAGKIYFLNPAPPLWWTFDELFTWKHFLWANQWNMLASPASMFTYDLNYYWRNPPPERTGEEFPLPHHQFDPYHATETWTFATEEVELDEETKVFEYVFTVTLESPQVYKMGDYSEPINPTNYKELPFTTTLEIRSRTKYTVTCLFRETTDNGTTFNAALSEFPLELDGDPITFAYQFDVSAWWLNIWGSWFNQSEMSATCTNSVTDHTNDGWEHYFGLTLAKDPISLPVVIVLQPDVIPQIGEICGENSESHIFYEPETTHCLTLWDRGTSNDGVATPMRAVYFTEATYSESALLAYVETLPSILWETGHCGYFFPPLPTWDPWTNFIEVDAAADEAEAGETTLLQQGALVLAYLYAGSRFHVDHADYAIPEYILADPDDPYSDRIYDTYPATMQVICSGTTVTIYAGQSDIPEYDPNDPEQTNPYPLTITYTLEAGRGVIFDANGVESTTFYYTGACTIRKHYLDHGFFVTGAQCSLRIFAT